MPNIISPNSSPKPTLRIHFPAIGSFPRDRQVPAPTFSRGGSKPSMCMPSIERLISGSALAEIVESGAGVNWISIWYVKLSNVYT